jgi:hypothetical protein
MGTARRAARSRRGRDGPAPTPCVQAECFDPLVRHCVACRLLRTPEPGRGKGAPGEEGAAPQDSGRELMRVPWGRRPWRGPHHPSLPLPTSTPPAVPPLCAVSPPSDPRPSPPSAPRPPSPSPPPASAASSQAPGTALQPQESVGAGTGPQAVLPLPGLLFGAPALLGLALALALVALVSWRWRNLRSTASSKAPAGGQDGESRV